MGFYTLGTYLYKVEYTSPIEGCKVSIRLERVCEVTGELDAMGELLMRKPPLHRWSDFVVPAGVVLESGASYFVVTYYFSTLTDRGGMERRPVFLEAYEYPPRRACIGDYPHKSL